MARKTSSATAVDLARRKTRRQQLIEDRICIWCYKLSARPGLQSCETCAVKHRWYAIYTNYGLTKKQYEELLDKQGGGCAICKRADLPLHVDHDHQTKIVRGILCHACNSALGTFGDCIAGLQLVIDYLQKDR